MQGSFVRGGRRMVTPRSATPRADRAANGSRPGQHNWKVTTATPCGACRHVPVKSFGRVGAFPRSARPWLHFREAAGSSDPPRY